ncbi:35522_t:CDS:1, partial [Racocetra persica]
NTQQQLSTNLSNTVDNTLQQLQQNEPNTTLNQNTDQAKPTFN